MDVDPPIPREPDVWSDRLPGLDSESCLWKGADSMGRSADDWPSGDAKAGANGRR
jgi:hypothetical protein